MWTRRDLLRAVGAGATLAALGPACGGGAPRRLAGPDQRERLRDALRAAVEVAGRRLAAPYAFASLRRRVRAAVDLDQRGLQVEERAIAIVGGRAPDGRQLERATDELSASAIAAAAAEVAALAGTSAPATVPVRRAPRDHTAVARDPRAVSRETWLAEAERLAARLDRHASSRIIYRAAWLVADDDERWIVRPDVDHRERRVRGQVGATLVAWQGGRPVAREVTAAAPGVPAAEQLTDEALADGAADVLTLFTPGGAPAGATAVMLAPALVAAVLDRLLADPEQAARVRPAALLTIVDDPAAAEAWAGHVVDDDGEPARAVTVAGGGQPLAASGSARRWGPRWRRARGPVHLDVAGGDATVDALAAAVATGAMLEGVRDVQLDRDGRLLVRATRTHELARGQRTGRVWGDVELRGDAGALLAEATGVSQERVAIVHVDDGPPRGALVPWLVTRGELSGGAAGGA